jgi:hypothetical protein
MSLGKMDSSDEKYSHDRSRRTLATLRVKFALDENNGEGFFVR